MIFYLFTVCHLRSLTLHSKCKYNMQYFFMYNDLCYQPNIRRRCVLHILFTYLDPHLCSTAAICKPGIPYFLFNQGQTSIKFAYFVPHFNYELLQHRYFQTATNWPSGKIFSSVDKIFFPSMKEYFIPNSII